MGLPPLPACDVHASAPSHFTDTTGRWGLSSALGTHLSTMDLDGDGYPDLIALSVDWNYIPARPDKTTTPRVVSVWMNRPNPAGGRMFVDATEESALFAARDGSTKAYRAPELAIAADIDNDGDLDLFTGKYLTLNPAEDVGDRSEIHLNDGKGHFTLAKPSAPRPTAEQRWPTTSATFTDVDRDGKIDLFVGFWYENYGSGAQGVQAQLYKGAGDGTFGFGTAAAGLTTDKTGFRKGTNHRPAYGVQACDLDGDGSPELLVAAYGRQLNLLYQNDGNGVFTEVGQASGYAGDAVVDYHDNEMYRCYCKVHLDEKLCEGAEKPIIVCPEPPDSNWLPGRSDQAWESNGNSYSTSCADFDGDGKMDLYTGEIRHWWAGKSSDVSELMLNDGAAGKVHFSRPGNDKTGMIWPHGPNWNEGGLYTSAFDADNDGREDVLVGATAYADQFSLVFHQKPDRTFEEVGAAWGLHHACAEGLAIADFDRDGDLDVIVGSGMGRDCGKIWKAHELHFYENDASAHAKWIAVRLSGDGTSSNKAGIGSRVTVTAGGESQVKELGGGFGYYGMQHDLVLFFGLGACAQIEKITVRWPDRDATTETFERVTGNRLIELRRGDPKIYDVLPR